MFGQNADALFTLEDLDKNRVGEKIFYPLSSTEYIENKTKRKEKLLEGEIRILGVDVALMGGKNNDSSVIHCIRLIPNGDHYVRKVAYSEVIQGLHTDDQALRIRRVFEDFQAHYIALDTAGLGISIFDRLNKVVYDSERDVEYEAWTTFNETVNDMKGRAKSTTALPIIYSIKGNRNLNHEIAVSLRANLQSGNIELPINELDAMEILKEKGVITDLTSEERKAELLMPYAQTTATVYEMINLDHEIIGGKIVVSEASGKRKDRYSALAYANWLAKHLENKNLSDDSDEWDDNRSYVIY